MQHHMRVPMLVCHDLNPLCALTFCRMPYMAPKVHWITVSANPTWSAWCGWNGREVSVCLYGDTSPQRSPHNTLASTITSPFYPFPPPRVVLYLSQFWLADVKPRQCTLWREIAFRTDRKTWWWWWRPGHSFCGLRDGMKMK